MWRAFIAMCVIALVTLGCGKIRLAGNGSDQPADQDSGASTADAVQPAAAGGSSVSAEVMASVSAGAIAELPPQVFQPAPKIPDGAAVPMPSGEEKVFAQPQHQFPLAGEVTGNEVEKLRNEYLEQRGWEQGFSRNNPGFAYIGWGQGAINVPPSDIRFGQARILAFEKAFQEAKGEFARVKGRLTTTETLRRNFWDDREVDPRALEDEGSRFEVIREKVEALTEAKLDNALVEAGVDPGEFAGRTPSQKRQILQDYISREIKVKAVQGVAGMRVQATFEDLHNVGVLVVYSEKMRAVANAVARGCTVSGGGKANPKDSIVSQIERASVNGDVDYITTHGVRVLIDDDGDRALVAFGQSSPKVRASDSKLKQNAAFQAARAAAQDMADGALTDFVNSSVVLESKTMMEESSEVNQIITQDFEEEQESINIGMAVDRLIKSRGHANLSGVVTLKQWTANHPDTGHLIFGHILMWSPTSQAAATGRWPTKKPVAGGRVAPEPENKTRQSPEFEDDF